MIVTTSWDDGHPLDFRLAELLSKYGLPATFYIPLENPERPAMPGADIRRLAEAGFEIGGHTLRHVRLLNVPPAVARAEIVDGKAALEDLLGREVRSFCYVGGQASPQLAAFVREAGFFGARTSARYRLWRPSPRTDRFSVPTTVQARDMSWREEAFHFLFTRNFAVLSVMLRAGLRRLPPGATGRVDFVDSVQYWLDRARKQGGVFHLWGHSWEIERFGRWGELEQVLAMLAETRGRAKWMTNGEVFNLKLPTPNSQ